MTTENTTDLEQEDSNAGGDQPNLEALQADLQKAQNEIAKYRNIAKQAQKERDEAKKKAPANQGEEDYKLLWQQSTEKLTKLSERTKSSAIEAALTAQLTKAGVAGDWMEAAVKLADHNLVEWDEDSGVDANSVVATVQKLKGAFPGMFEKKVNKTDAKVPADGPTSEKTISRAEYDRLMKENPEAWVAKRKAGYRVA